MRSVHGTTRILLLLLILLPPFITIITTTVTKGLSAPDRTDINERAGTSEISADNPVPHNSDLEALTTSSSATTTYANLWGNGACSSHYLLPPRSSVGCDPSGGSPCCGAVGFCGNTHEY